MPSCGQLLRRQLTLREPLECARERRLRLFLRHESLSVATALAEFQHHTAPRGQRMVRAGGVEHEVNYEPRLQNPPLPQAAGVQHSFLGDDEPPAAGSRPDWLFAVSGPQEQDKRRTVAQLEVTVPSMPVLDVPVPLMVGGGGGLGVRKLRAFAGTWLGWDKPGIAQPWSS